MEPEALKKAFGERVVFWGGIDEQHLLPHGTREEILASVEKTTTIMARDGGYVLAPSHNIQEDTPVENVMSMFEAARKYRSRTAAAGGYDAPCSGK